MAKHEAELACGHYEIVARTAQAPDYGDYVVLLDITGLAYWP